MITTEEVLISRRRHRPSGTKIPSAPYEFRIASVFLLALVGYCAARVGIPSQASTPGQTGPLPERYALAEVWTGETRSMYHPAGLDWDTGGIVWAAEQGAHRVRNFRSNGDPAYAWPARAQPSSEPGGFRGPEDVAADAARELVFVADTGNQRVQVLGRRTGAFVAEWTSVGVPRGIAVTDDGALVVVTDSASHSVRVFSPDGTQIRQFGGFGRAVGQFDTPIGVDIDTDGTIYVADSGNRRVQWLDPEGRPIGSLLLDGSVGPGGIPLDVAIDDDQTMFVAVARGVLRFRYRNQFAEQIAPGNDAGPGVDPEPIPQNHEGVRGVTVRPGVGMAFSYAPALGSPDRVMLFPERWFPTGVIGSAGPRSMDDPFRVDGSGPIAVVRDSTSNLRIFEAGGRWYDPFHTFFGGEGVDVAAASTGTPCIPMCSPLAAVSLSGNQARLAWLSCFANCEMPPSYEILSEAMRLRQDCRGFDREADDLWWNRVISASSADEHAILDAGRGSVTVRRRDPMIPMGDPGWMALQGGIRLERSTDFRSFADVDHDAGGNLYVLARDGGILRYDARGRGLDGMDLNLPGGRTGEALAVGAAGEVFVLTNDEYVLKYDTSARLRAAWSVPELAGPGTYTDVAIGPDGKILVPDAQNDRILAFAPTEGTSEVPSAGHEQCELIPNKTASPARLQMGESTEVTLEIQAACPGDALDLVIVIETDCGMSGDRLRYLREAAAGFANSLSGDRQVAVVTFGPEIDTERGGARLFQPFTSDRNALAGALGTVNTSCLPFIESRPVDLAEGLGLARETLSGPAARPGAAKAVLVIAPGRSRREVVMWEARQLWRDRAKVYTLALGQDRYCAGLPPDEGLLAAMAVPVTAARRVDDPEALPEALALLARELSGASSGLDQITVTDRIPANMRLVSGSADPPADVQPDGSLVWTLDASAATSWQMRFRLEPLAVGIWPTNVEAFAQPSGPRAGPPVIFPVPTVEVWIPEPTPSSVPPSPTPTASPTSSPDRPTSTPLRPPTITPQPTSTRPVVQRHTVYLPQLYASDGCVPSTRPVDVALVVDTSSSMTPDKLALARSAASGFVDLLALPRDRGAIVSFDSQARTVQALTTDRTALHLALGSLNTSVGTRIDLGLGEGLAAVAGVDARAGADPVLVLLTDGRPDGGTHQQVLTMAELARDLGVVVYTIGLGDDVDAELLKEVAGQNDRYFPAPTAADLARIYGAVAKRIPCR